MARTHNKGAQKTLFLNFTFLRWERNSFTKCRSDKIVVPLLFNIAKKSGFLSDLKNPFCLEPKRVRVLSAILCAVKYVFWGP